MTIVQSTTMQNKHIEHLEDTILTGDLSALDMLLNPELFMSVKIDGAPAIVWGTDPATGDFFVGTKSVFNKKKNKICYNQEDVFRLYSKQPKLIEILCACLKYLPRGEFIYQGDFIGFGGSDEYTPNTITYKFPEIVRHIIIIAPHTEYLSATTLADAQVVGPIDDIIDGNDACLFVQPAAYIQHLVHGPAAFDDLKELIDYAKQMSTLVNFVSDKESSAIKKQLNACIRAGIPIVDTEFDCDHLLIGFWKLIKSIKEDALYVCRNNGPEAYIGYDRINAEGYVISAKGKMIKLVNREVFSYHNFNSGAFNNVTV